MTTTTTVNTFNECSTLLPHRPHEKVTPQNPGSANVTLIQPQQKRNDENTNLLYYICIYPFQFLSWRFCILRVFNTKFVGT